ncbi:MAG: TnpV protein [Oscillospiraceae bacterium]|nr:TnpV protein [Oscillospiraceae bacterium]
MTYRLAGDYPLPNLTLNEPPDAKPPGHYGRMRRAYPREHRPAFYPKMLPSETPFPHLREIDEAARSGTAAIQDREIAREMFSPRTPTPRGGKRYPTTRMPLAAVSVYDCADKRNRTHPKTAS